MQQRPLARRSHTRDGALGRALPCRAVLLRKCALPRGISDLGGSAGRSSFFRLRLRAARAPRGVFAAGRSGKEPDTCTRQPGRISERDMYHIVAFSERCWVFQRFLTSVGGLIPKQGENKTRIRSLSPNEAAVALWVDTGDFTLLLGADLERSGWVAVVASPTRPTGKASAFKVPHHGSENADEPTVWQQMLESDPLAVLTPWRRGGHALPTAQDVVRILAATQNAYVTDNGLPRRSPRHGNSAVARTLRESGSRFRRLTADNSSVRLRRPLGSQTQWTVETLGRACRLMDFAA